MSEKIGRRSILGAAAALGAGVLGAQSADAKLTHPKTVPPDQLPDLTQSGTPEIPVEPQTTDYYDTFDTLQAPSEHIECKQLSDIIEVDARIIDLLNADPEHFYLDPATGSLRVASFRQGKPGAQPVYEGAVDIRTIQHIRVVGLPEGNGVHLTVVFKDNHRQRVRIRRAFFGDYLMDFEEPERLMNYPGERRQI